MSAAPVPDASLPAERLLAEAGFLSRLARELVGDAARAEDLVQDTFVAALERPPQGGGSLRAWLATVARNLAINVRRGEGRRARREEIVARAEQVEPDGEALERLETSRTLVECVLTLPVEQRTVLYLRYYEGLAPTEIAARLGAPLKTVKSRHTRALAALRERLDGRARGDRRAWMLALAPLARGGTGPSLAAGTGLLGGLVMKKMLVTAALVVLLCLGWLVLPRLVGSQRTQGAHISTTALVTPPPAPALPLPPEFVEAREPFSALGFAADVAVHGALELALTWSDGTPAVGVGVELPGPRGARRSALAAVGDADGLVRFAELVSGTTKVVFDMRGRREVEIVAGTTTRVTHVLEDGLDVAGCVLDERGDPLAGATIAFDASYSGAPDVQPVTSSDSEGRFRLRDVVSLIEIGARARGFLPSNSYNVGDLAPTPEGNRSVEFRLARGGGSLAGRVLDAAGAPLAGARVMGGPRGGYAVEDKSGQWGTAAKPFAVTSGADGGFELLDTIPLGRQAVHAFAPGLAPWSGEVEIVAGETRALEIRLGEPARVRGRVLSTDGAPIAGVKVLQSIEAFGGWYEDDYPPAEDVTDADGRFVLEWLAPGTRELNAHDFRRPQIGRARATVECVAGATTRCELRLELGNTIAGSVRDETGAALVGWVVAADSSDVMERWYLRQTTTDALGRFRIVNLGPGEHDVRVRAPDELPARAERERVPVGTEDLELVVRGASEPRGTVRGRIVDPMGAPLDDIRITFWRLGANEGYFLELDPSTGFFQGESIAGEYRIEVKRGSSALAEVPALALVEGDLTDLGDVLLGARGRLEITLRGFMPELLGELRCHLARAGLDDIPLENEHGVLRSPEILTGTWELVLTERELALDAREFEVVAGQTVRQTVTVSLTRR